MSEHEDRPRSNKTFGTVLAFGGQKGGIGKSTLAFGMGYALAANHNLRTLLVDADSQQSLTRMTGATVGDETLATVLGQNNAGTGNTAGAIVNVCRNLDLLPSEDLLAQTELGLVMRLNRERQLSNALAKVRNDYDYILIDSPPSLGLLTINILLASTSVVIPTQLEPEAVNGIRLYTQTIQDTYDVFGEGATLLGIAVSMADMRLTVSDAILEALRSNETLHVFDAIVPRATAVNEAALMHQSIQQYNANSKAAIETNNLTNEIIERIHNG